MKLKTLVFSLCFLLFYSITSADTISITSKKANIRSGPGPRTIKVKNKDYREWEERVRVSAGRSVSLTANLKPARARPGRTFTNSHGMEFVLIPAGSFIMGSPSNEAGRDNHERQHQVTLTKEFYIQTTELTQWQWKAVMGGNPSWFSDCGDDCPVEKVSWDDVQEFIRRLNQKEGIDKYRLPTEAEWEYAARAGSTTAFANGGITELVCGHDSNLDAMGWYCGNSGKKTHPVAQNKPNAWGLFDMHGNVWEMCQDWFGKYPSGVVTDPKGPASGTYRVDRGGSWVSFARYGRSASRRGYTPYFRVNRLGFRLARTF